MSISRSSRGRRLGRDAGRPRLLAGEERVLFASGSYLINPQDTNETPSIVAILGLLTNTGQFGARRELGARPASTRLGGSVPVWKGIASPCGGWKDCAATILIGDSHVMAAARC